MESAALKVGELARRTGLTVRTLHHYDDIGLLSPSRRTPAGHRLYALTEVRRLQQIASLRQLGLSLEDIRGCLDRPEYTLEQVLDLQIRRLRDEITRQRRLCTLLEALRDRVRSETEDLSLDDLTNSVQATLDFGKYYTPEQLERIARRGAELGPERIRGSQVEWQELLAAFGRAMEEGLDPASDDVQALASKAYSLVEEFTGGDPGIRSGLTRMCQEEGGENILARYGTPLKEGLWEYYTKAMKASGLFGGSPESRP
ncbi:MAG: MerR family transcriptional regulator [Gemmatimonadetes bacterium]|nr:MerR family transcriptional regulator [Gemmatimonadota bacterium]